MAETVNIVEQLKVDLEEVKRLLPLTTRQRIIGVLSIEKGRIEAELARQEKTSQETHDDKSVHTAVKERATVTIKTYGWDQSDRFAKVYVTIAGVQTVPASNVSVQFGDQSFKLLVQDLRGSNHQLLITSLLKAIIPKDSYYKIKTDSVVIFLKKREQNSWSFLTKTEQKLKDKSKSDSKPADNADPNAGLMDMMKKMYDDGDDEMKRTIAKAWTESRDKQNASGVPDM